MDSLSEIRNYLTMGFLLEGAWLTIKITVISLVGSFIAGAALAWLRGLSVPVIPQIAWGYIWIIRGTPILLQLVFIYNALPSVGVNLDPVPAVVVGLILHEAAYMAEIFRAGVNNVPQGLRLASWSLGMGKGLTFTRIIAPNAWRSIAPAITNQAIILLKGTALASVVAVPELTLRSEQIVASNFKFFPVFISAGIMYLAMTTALSGAQALLERNSRRNKARNKPPRTRLPRALGTIFKPRLDSALSVVAARNDFSEDKFLSIQHLNKHYGSELAVDDANLDVRRGEVVVIMGPSGSGKSTFLRCAAQLEDQTQALVDVGAHESRAMQRKRFRPHSRNAVTARRELRIGMVFQDFNLFPHMTILENLMEAQITVLRRSPEEAKAKALEVLDLVNLGDRKNFFPEMLSGGQQQRAAIGRALAAEPNVIFFDEPTSALDKDLVAEVLSTMRRLADLGMTMVVVTHEEQFAHEVADRIIRFQDGHLRPDGTPTATPQLHHVPSHD